MDTFPHGTVTIRLQQHTRTLTLTADVPVRLGSRQHLQQLARFPARVTPQPETQMITVSLHEANSGRRIQRFLLDIDGGALSDTAKAVLSEAGVEW